VALSSSVGATIHYTIDGTTPTATSDVYSTPLAIDRTRTVMALGVLSGWTQSAIGSWTYTLVAADPALSPTGGLFGTAQRQGFNGRFSMASAGFTFGGSPIKQAPRVGPGLPGLEAPVSPSAALETRTRSRSVSALSWVAIFR
jgi:hypothetical protein